MAHTIPTVFSLRTLDRGKALPRHAREHNRSLVMRTLYDLGPRSRADLARATGLAKVTVSEVVAELLQAGYLRELGPRSNSRPGKPAVDLDLAWDRYLVVAVDVSDHEAVHGALMTIGAELTIQTSLPRSGATGQDAAELVYCLVESLLESAGRPVLGIGVGTPGIVDANGTVLVAPNLGWKNTPLQADLSQRFGLPTTVSNDANLAALGERIYGVGVEDFALIKFGQGIGAGLILGGELLTGTRHTVGEIGHFVTSEVETEAEGHDYDTARVLERQVAVPTLLARLDAHPRQRDEILAEAGRRLGSALAPIISMLDLTEVVLCGPSELLQGPFSEETMKVVRQRTLPQTNQDLTIRLSTEGDNLVLLGCVAQVLSTFLGLAKGTLQGK